MGTRADFYVGRGAEAEWLGSIAWDGHPCSVFEDAPELFAGPPLTESEWRSWVAGYLAGRRDGTKPEMGWPWPWEDSRTTDYAYAYDGKVHGSSFGAPWFVVDPEAEDWGEPEWEKTEKVAFPDMTARQNVNFGARSGAMFISLATPGER